MAETKLRANVTLTFQNLFDAANKALAAGDAEQARRLRRKACEENPAVWGCLANKSLQAGDDEFAMEAYQDVIETTKDDRVKALALNDLGMILWRRLERESAERLFLQSYAINKRIPETLHNMAMVAFRKHDRNRARKLLDAAQRLNPRMKIADFTRALTHLIEGDYENGWRMYESRFYREAGNLKKPNLPFPELRYLREARGKRVIIYAEQGTGDTIMMLRYVPLLAEICELTVVPQAPIVQLVNEQGWNCKVTARYEGDPNFDFSLPMMSLPRVFETRLNTIPKAPYLRANPAYKREECLMVGIAWAGSPEHAEDGLRSIPMASLDPVLKTNGVSWVSLMVGPRSIDGLCGPAPMMQPFPCDYLETAGIIAGLDLVITVDTSVAHLAGALGVPCWIMLPYNPDFRWLLDRADSPWYPSVTLFRQHAYRDWNTVIEGVAFELKKKTANIKTTSTALQSVLAVA